MADLKRLQADNAKLRAAMEDVLKHSYMPIEKVRAVLAKALRATKHSGSSQ